MDPEDAEVLNRAGKAYQGLFRTLGEAVNEYSQLLRRPDPQRARERAESMARAWRESAELTRFEQLELMPTVAVDFYGALESSLIVLSSSDENATDLALSGDELATGLLRAGGDRTPVSGAELLDAAWFEKQTREGVPRTDRPDDWPRLPDRHSTKRDTPKSVVVGLGTELSETLDFLVGVSEEHLDPPGALTDHARRALEQAIRRSARIELKAERSAPQITVGDWNEGFSPLLGAIRSARRSMTLALSSHPERQKLAEPYDELYTRVFVMYRMLDGSTRQEAADELRARIEAASGP